MSLREILLIPAILSMIDQIVTGGSFMLEDSSGLLLEDGSKMLLE